MGLETYHVHSLRTIQLLSGNPYCVVRNDIRSALVFQSEIISTNAAKMSHFVLLNGISMLETKGQSKSHLFNATSSTITCNG